MTQKGLTYKYLPRYLCFLFHITSFAESYFTCITFDTSPIITKYTRILILDLLMLSIQQLVEENVSEELKWEEEGTKCTPALFFGFYLRDHWSMLLQQDIRAAIACKQPRIFGPGHSRFDMDKEWETLGDWIVEEHLFKAFINEKKHAVFQLEPGAICWADPRCLFVALLLNIEDREARRGEATVEFVSMNSKSSYKTQWRVDEKVYFAGTGIRAKSCIKFYVIQFRHKTIK
ncbi:hypothetical protein BGZ63DRAFT_468189, partial [Mariannaea sp. PMI_226]